MANDDTFTVTSSWQAVEANAADITNGIFTVFNQGNKRVGLIKSDTLPTDSNGATYMDKAKDSSKFTLSATENLFCKTDTGTATIGVVTA